MVDEEKLFTIELVAGVFSDSYYSCYEDKNCQQYRKPGSAYSGPLFTGASGAGERGMGLGERNSSR